MTTEYIHMHTRKQVRALESDGNSFTLNQNSRKGTKHVYTNWMETVWKSFVMTHDCRLKNSLKHSCSVKFISITHSVSPHLNVKWHWTYLNCESWDDAEICPGDVKAERVWSLNFSERLPLFTSLDSDSLPFPCTHDSTLSHKKPLEALKLCFPPNTHY